MLLARKGFFKAVIDLQRGNVSVAGANTQLDARTAEASYYEALSARRSCRNRRKFAERGSNYLSGAKISLTPPKGDIVISI